MSAPPYMKLYWGDYHRDTRHLTTAQHGAYFLLLGEAWRLGGALPDDDRLLAGWTLLSGDEWAEMRGAVMAFFTLSRGAWKHKRVRAELAHYGEVSRKRKSAGKTGGASTNGRSAGNSQANATQMPTQPKPEPEPLEGNPQPPSGATDRDFLEKLLSAYPDAGKASTSPDKARVEAAKACATLSPDALLKAVRAFAASDYAACDQGRRVPSLQRWLRDKRYEVWLETPDAGGAPWAGPFALRAAVEAAKGPAWAASWLLPCAWRDLPSPTLVAPREIVAHRLREVADLLAGAGVTVVTEKAA